MLRRDPLSNQLTSFGDADRNPVVVLAADENFAMPLAATVRSALDHLAPNRMLRIYVLDAGLRDATKERLVQSWPAGRFHLTWVGVDSSMLCDVPVSGHVNVVSYYRILMPRILPAELRRVIYLDSDLIVRADLGRLWDRELAGYLCLAAQDCAAPYLDASTALPNYELCRPHLGSPKPIANYRELGLNPQAAYFNAGVLLVDLDAWRTADLAGMMLACLDENKEHVLWWDQYALNVVLAGRWSELDTRWNQGANVYAYPTWSQSPFDRQAFDELRNDPYIVHFTTRYKPWLLSCLHPLRKQFFETIDRTAWAGWRPWRTLSLRSFLDLAHAQERRFRQGRRKLGSRFAQWLDVRRAQAKL